jgi:hypothetical protein
VNNPGYLPGNAKVTGGTFDGNRASAGGALSSYAATVENSALIANRAANDGGGWFLTNSGVSGINDSLVAWNLSGGKGGGLLLEGNTKISGCSLHHNQAYSGGGVFHFKLAGSGVHACRESRNISGRGGRLRRLRRQFHAPQVHVDGQSRGQPGRRVLLSRW